MSHFVKLKEIILDKLNVEDTEVKEDASFIDDLGADSLDIVELIMALEDEFDIEIPDEKVESIKTVKDVLNYIEEYASKE